MPPHASIPPSGLNSTRPTQRPTRTQTSNKAPVSADKPSSVDQINADGVQDQFVEGQADKSYQAGGKPSQVLSAGVSQVNTPLKTTTIKVHGEDITVRFDPSKASEKDIKLAQEALSKYPKKWVKSIMSRADSNGESRFELRLVGRDRMARSDRHAEGVYDKSKNTLTLNMDAFSDFVRDKSKFVKDVQGYTRDEFFQRTVVHEFAHHIDDVGSKPQGALDGRATDNGEFGKIVTSRPRNRPLRQSVSPYDHRTGNKPNETFAETVTTMVLEGEKGRRRLLANPHTQELTQRAIEYLDNGGDPRALQLKSGPELSQKRQAALGQLQNLEKRIIAKMGSASPQKKAELQSAMAEVRGMQSELGKHSSVQSLDDRDRLQGLLGLEMANTTLNKEIDFNTIVGWVNGML